nr:U17_MYRTX_Pc1a [Pogonomyrmex californicus]
MENRYVNTFTTYLLITFLLISTFITMAVTESHIIQVPCLPGYVKVGKDGVCREAFKFKPGQRPGR